jgi:anti-sigma B factor antagonist
MDLLLRETEHHGVPVLSLKGDLDLATVPRLRDRLVRAAAEHGGKTLVVDLDGVAFLDSTGLGVLVGGLRRMRSMGGDLALVSSSPALAETMALTGLDRVFAVHATVCDAVGVAAGG